MAEKGLGSSYRLELLLQIVKFIVAMYWWHGGCGGREARTLMRKASGGHQSDIATSCGAMSRSRLKCAHIEDNLLARNCSASWVKGKRSWRGHSKVLINCLMIYNKDLWIGGQLSSASEAF